MNLGGNAIEKVLFWVKREQDDKNKGERFKRKTGSWKKKKKWARTEYPTRARRKRGGR